MRGIFSWVERAPGERAKCKNAARAGGRGQPLTKSPWGPGGMAGAGRDGGGRAGWQGPGGMAGAGRSGSKWWPPGGRSGRPLSPREGGRQGPGGALWQSSRISGLSSSYLIFSPYIGQWAFGPCLAGRRGANIADFAHFVNVDSLKMT